VVPTAGQARPRHSEGEVEVSEYMEDLEPDTGAMSVYVRCTYERIRQDVLTTQSERIAIVAALTQMQTDLERDLY